MLPDTFEWHNGHIASLILKYFAMFRIRLPSSSPQYIILDGICLLNTGTGSTSHIFPYSFFANLKSYTLYKKEKFWLRRTWYWKVFGLWRSKRDTWLSSYHIHDCCYAAQTFCCFIFFTFARKKSRFVLLLNLLQQQDMSSILSALNMSTWVFLHPLQYYFSLQ